MAIDYSAGYTSRWRLMRVNPETWEDAGEVPGMQEATVSRSASGSSPLLESAVVAVTAGAGDAPPTGWHRIEMLAMAGGETELHEIGTFHLVSSSGAADRGSDSLQLGGSSVLKPAASENLPAGTSVPKGADGAAWAADMLSAYPAQVYAAGSFTVDDVITFDGETSVLDAVWRVLDAAGWCLAIDGHGRITVQPMPSDPALVLGPGSLPTLQPRANHSSDVAGVVNRYRAVDGPEVAVAENDDPASPTSAQSLGYWNDKEDRSPVRIDGETLQAYAERKLSEASTVRTEYSYTREWVPGVFPLSLVRASVPAWGLDGDLRVTRQSIRCDKGATVDETAAYEEVTYPWA